MTLRLRVLPFVFAAAILPSVHAHDTDSQSGPLGKVSFPTSCNPKVQAQFERAVAMLHSFWYSAGERAFRDVLKDDPSCAIAHWGIASLQMSNPLAGQGASPKGAEMAQLSIDEARRIGLKTDRERDFVSAVAAYYQDFATRPERDRQVARSDAYQALAKKYPSDDEAQIFAALYLAGTQTQADQTYAAYLKAATVLEEEFRKYPDHPGVAHYLIHSYDAPPIATKGLTAARRYATIAPAAPHALHMPSHIFTRTGDWPESAATNLRSRDVAIAGNEPDEAYHASDYMVYAYLQLARDSDARKAIEAAMKVEGASTRFVAPYAIASMPARYVFERRAWQEAANLKPIGSPYPFVESITYFARSVGAARTGDLAAARKDAAQLEALHKALLDAKNAYWANEVEVQRLAAAGWIALGEGKTDEALKFMRAAADLEDKNEKHIVTPGRLIPARELLGDMLLETKQPALALVEFEASQQREPNRYRSYVGAARAAELSGNGEKAASYYRKLLALAKDADTPRPELASAKQYASEVSAFDARLGALAVRFGACLLLAALAGFASLAAADPEESDPDLAKRDQDYAAGKAAAERKDWAAAIQLYQRAERRHPDQADLQNSLGFAYRNLKQYDLAFKHYKRAIEIDPRHRGAHEYIGEAYLMTGDLKSAEVHLVALKKICLLPCEELTDLERAIEKYRGKK